MPSIRRPCGTVSLRDDTTATRRCRTAVSSRRYALCDPVTLTFDLIFIVWQGIAMDYLCAKFGHCTFSRFDFIALNMFMVFSFFDLSPVTLTFDLLTYVVFIGGIVMHYPCAKFCDFGLSRFGFYVRSYAEARNRYRMDVRRSVTRWYCIKTAEHIAMLSSPHDSPFILVLCISRSSRNSDGVTPCGGTKQRWGLKMSQFSTNNSLYLRNG